MSFLDKAKELAEKMTEKAGPLTEKAKPYAEKAKPYAEKAKPYVEKAAPYASKAADLAGKGVAEAASVVDKATHGKYHDRIETVSDKARTATTKLSESLKREGNGSAPHPKEDPGKPES